MHIGHIELFVKDPQYSLTFYRDILGFSVTDVQTGHFVWLKVGNYEILLRPGTPNVSGKTYEESAVGIVLYTDHLQRAVAELEGRGLRLEQLPDSCYAFEDPDGHWFQLVDPHHKA